MDDWGTKRLSATIRSGTSSAPGSRLTPVTINNQATWVTSKTQLKGRCPTTNININGKLVPALLDTDSDVTTVTDTWANKHLQGLRRQNCHLALRGVDGTEIPNARIVIVDVSVLG